MMTTNNDQNNDACDTFSGFNPPLYRQRYTKALDIITRLNVNTLIDFGCAELKFLNYVIAGNDVNLYSLESIIGVDLDDDLLEECKDKLRPLGCQYLCKRFKALEVGVFAGSVSEKDERLKKALNGENWADKVDENNNLIQKLENFNSKSIITIIELIEHLNPDTLKNLPDNIFNFLSPDHVFITTPNSEFNVLFPDFTGTRHWDHKFEWTRAEFKIWVDSVVADFPEYEYSLVSIGETKMSKIKNLGPCSQGVLFSKKQVPETQQPKSQKSSMNPPKTAKLQKTILKTTPKTTPKTKPNTTPKTTPKLGYKHIINYSYPYEPAYIQLKEYLTSLTYQVVTEALKKNSCLRLNIQNRDCFYFGEEKVEDNTITMLDMNVPYPEDIDDHLFYSEEKPYIGRMYPENISTEFAEKRKNNEFEEINECSRYEDIETENSEPENSEPENTRLRKNTIGTKMHTKFNPKVTQNTKNSTKNSTKNIETQNDNNNDDYTFIKTRHNLDWAKWQMINLNLKSATENQYKNITESSEDEFLQNQDSTLFMQEKIDYFKIKQEAFSEKFVRIDGSKLNTDDNDACFEFEVQLKPPYLFKNKKSSLNLEEIIVPSYLLIESFDVSKRLQDYLIFEGLDSLKDVMELYGDKIDDKIEDKIEDGSDDGRDVIKCDFWSYDKIKNVFKIKLESFLGTGIESENSEDSFDDENGWDTSSTSQGSEKSSSCEAWRKW